MKPDSIKLSILDRAVRWGLVKCSRETESALSFSVDHGTSAPGEWWRDYPHLAEKRHGEE